MPPAVRRDPQPEAATDAASPFAADGNVGLFVAFRMLFNIRFYYPVFMVMFLDFGISVEEFGLLNAVWAAAIVLLEVPSGALADLVGRKRLLVAGAGLMVVEMLILCLVPVPSPWVMPALLANRILSGTAEAFVSGADEALAFDSLQARGLASRWPRVLERLMQWSGITAVVAMVAGSLVYDPRLLNAVTQGIGWTGGFTPAQTFRLPIWLTLGSAVAAVAVALAMREPERSPSAGATPATPGLLAPFRQVAATGRWILGQPLVLVVIMAGVLIDQPIRQILVVASEIYRQIGIPDRFFGLVSAGSAIIGLLTATSMRRLAMQRSPLFNFWLLAGVTLVGLAGTAALSPWWSVGCYMLLSMALRMEMFLNSHYLNQIVESDQRATVLSFRGLAVNVSYGLMSLGFAGAVGVVDLTAGPAPEDGTFRTVVRFLPGYFMAMCAIFVWWARRSVPTAATFAAAGQAGAADEASA